MRTAILIDDEQDATEMLSITLVKHFGGQVEIVGTSNLFGEGLLLVQDLAPDLLFLDIDLGDGNSGFDLLESLKDMPKIPRIVFVTGYNQFAVKALRVQAIDYLLKPAGRQDIAAMLDRLDDLEANAPTSSDLEPGVVVRNNDAIHRLPLADITYFMGVDNYTNIFLNNRQLPILASITLKNFEDDVMRISNKFFRVHKSYMVNLQQIDRIEKGVIDRSLILKNGDRIPISRRRFKAFSEAYLHI